MWGGVVIRLCGSEAFAFCYVCLLGGLSRFVWDWVGMSECGVGCRGGFAIMFCGVCGGGCVSFPRYILLSTALVCNLKIHIYM